jgi:hypothetical protein
MLKQKASRLASEIVLGISGAAAPLLAFAQSNTPPITSAQALLNFMCTIFSWMFYFLITLSLIMILVAAFTYVTANGNPEKVGKATKMILYAAIGIAVALIAKGVPSIIASILGAQGSFLAC